MPLAYGIYFSVPGSFIRRLLNSMNVVLIFRPPYAFAIHKIGKAIEPSGLCRSVIDECFHGCCVF
jgi:hypothetical protein